MVLKLNLSNFAQNTKTNERDTKLKEYNALKEKALGSTGLSEADQKRLNALEKELKGRNIINSSGQEASNSQCIWDKGKPELSSQDYMMNEAVKGFQEDKQNQEEKMSNFISGFKEFMNNHDR